MTRVRSTDTSVLPAAARSTDGHTHPMPRYARALVVLVPLLFVLSLLLGYVGLKLEASKRDAAIIAELDRRTADRQRQFRETQTALCGVLREDLAGSPNAANLARQYDCPEV